MIVMMNLLFMNPSAHHFAGVSLAYRPFLDPIDAHSWWLFLSLPLVFGIAVAYKAIRLPTLTHYWRQVFKMTTQVMAAAILMCVALYVLVEVAVPYM